LTSLLGEQAERTTTAADDTNYDDKDGNPDDDPHQLGETEKKHEIGIISNLISISHITE
jgi:hypothetical protein